MPPITYKAASSNRPSTLVTALTVGGAMMMAGSAGADDTVRFSPSLGVQELYSSNILGVGPGAKPDLVTQISPGITVDENGPQSTLNLQYTPTLDLYELGNSANRIDQNLVGYGRFTPFTEALEILVDAYATETSGNANSTDVRNGYLVPSADRVLLYLGDVKPHVTFHFGDLATVDAYYRLKSANTSDQGNTSSGPHPLSTNSLNQDAQVVVSSGDKFGRVGAQINLDHDIGTGSGQNT